ncbi:ubiquinone anaerobic biosynthesis accessory factor UbiT [Paraferrimonas sedimenticola]|uniref:Ubiquinone biosynthesis accessory factor UbiT n=1 Tax=Paraferrimonas sedimenticola TaxID=375674 RepID=A0AA37RVW6_9GAMM|nr:SCP2 sterol-binding domain-containing protein [Paraferrimonas sedimenticola]GLP96770.1 SCP-2 sterol transfer family protein [Paraferrimonas sedimenticola]
MNLPLSPETQIKLAKQAVSAIPKIAKPSLKLVPFHFQAKLIESLLAMVLRDAIDNDELEFLEGNWVGIEITDLELRFAVSFDGQGFVVSEHADCQVQFSADGQSLVLIAAMQEDPDTLFFQRKLNIEGDTELGLEVKNLLMQVDFAAMPVAVRHGIGQLAELIKAAS